MITIARTVRSTASAEDALAYLADFRNATEWDSGTVRCERLSGDGGVGTRYRNVSSFAGREIELVYETLELSDRHLVIEGANKTTTSRDTITVRRAGAGCEVEYRADFTLRGPARFLGPIMRVLFERLANETEKTLKAALDTLGGGS